MCRGSQSNCVAVWCVVWNNHRRYPPPPSQLSAVAPVLFLFIATSSFYFGIRELYSATPSSLFSLCDFIAVISLFPTNSTPDFPSYELLLMMPLLTIRLLLAAITLSLTAPRFIFLIIPVFYCFSTHFIFCPSLTDLQQKRILFFFLLAGAYCPDTHSNRPGFLFVCYFHNAEIKGASETLIVLVMRAKRYGFSLVFKDVITAVRLCFH